MSSEQIEPWVVSKVTTLEVFQDIDKDLPEIIKYLETESCSADFGSVLQILMKDGFKHYGLESIQRVFLQDILRATKKIFSDCLDSVKFNLETESGNSPSDTEFSLNQLLKVILDILDSYRCLLNQLSCIEATVEAECLDSVPKILTSVTGNAFVHCRDSESIYGRYFSNCSASLSDLFRKSFEVQTCLLKVLDEKFVFNSQSDDDICLLLLVLDKVTEISEIVSSFEATGTAVVDQWKGFVKITSKYSQCLRNRLDLTPTFICLTSTLHKILSSLTNQNDCGDRGASLNRHLKLGNFVLKVVIKLCELYSGYLSQISHQLLLQLLINLLGQDQKLCSDEELSKLFRSYITIGASPLLTHLLSDSPFVKEVKELCSEKGLKNLRNDCKIGVFLLGVNICRKLLISSPQAQILWLDQDLIQSILNILAHCGCEVKSAAFIEEREGYSTVVASVAILMTSQLNNQQFQTAEKLLFNSFLHGNFLVRIFVEDLLCLLARLTCESVVISWLDWLELVRKLPNTKHTQYHPVLVHLSHLEQRLLLFLSPKARKSRLDAASENLTDLLSVTQPTARDFNKIVECVERLKLDVGTQESEDTLMLLWRCVDFMSQHLVRPSATPTHLNETLHKSTLWYSRLVLALNSATINSLQHINHLETILDIMQRLIQRSESFLKLAILETVYTILSQSTFTPSQQALKTCYLILISCVEDPLPIIKLTSLEILSKLKNAGLNCPILHEMLSNNTNLNNILSDYMNGILIVDSIESQDIFLQDETVNFVHRCSSVIINLSDVENEPPAKKVKIFSSLINQFIAKAKLIQKEMKKCLNDNKDGESLSNSQKNLLSDLISSYEEFKCYL